MKKDLRNEIPEVSRFIDSLRDAFGKEMIDAQIRKGMKGERTFYARENGIELGTKVCQEVKHEQGDGK
ncbi:hypothetical protein SAMN06265795_12228 [Noviherbaspirillum humi]|uniref:Uncharacterized protein n=1 Tax=Noviherbaspirillum humi TaxID=1688639 RepID=A0A239LFQ0_9BURK|nr:hypothetical protein [Noviherbaspirillum humi]SNT28772.1 hypothetical protein SAMN06265795_12228 [Noviherbaspirillum humi]